MDNNDEKVGQEVVQNLLDDGYSHEEIQEYLEGLMKEDEEPVTAAHVVGAVVDGKPADVQNMFADLVLDKIREKLEDKKQELAATYYGWQPQDNPEPEFDVEDEDEPPQVDDEEDPNDLALGKETEDNG